MGINYNKFEVYFKYELVCKVRVEGVKVYVENLVDGILSPFSHWGNEVPFDVFVRWIEDRVVPKSRVGVEDYIKGLGLEVYNARLLFNRTHGTMYTDDWWVKFEGEEDMTYEKARDY